MKRELLKTGDGSYTIHIPEWNEQYHSKHGAINEARHVFIKNGLHYFLQLFPNYPINILEIGFGTGLNALITFQEAGKLDLDIRYNGVEAFPIDSSEIEKLNYPELLEAPEDIFRTMHDSEWESDIHFSDHFSLLKNKRLFSEISSVEKFNIIYFDAFGARVQPELWTEEVFEKMYAALKPNGILVTYAAKGSVRRAMQTVGFTVERLEGPPGKREMLRATKQ